MPVPFTRLSGGSASRRKPAHPQFWAHTGQNGNTVTVRALGYNHGVRLLGLGVNP
jgi:hypothetical protein